MAITLSDAYGSSFTTFEKCTWSKDSNLSLMLDVVMRFWWIQPINGYSCCRYKFRLSKINTNDPCTFLKLVIVP